MSEPILLLPGMMCDARLFTAQITAFSTSHSIMLASLTGRCTIQELAQDILRKAPERFALLGLSMGGIVAMEIIKREPERVTRLALFDTNCKADTPERVIQRDAEIQRVQAGELVSVMRDDIKPNYLAENDHKQEVLTLCMNMALAHGAKVFIEQSEALKTRPDQSEGLKNITVPTLIVHGTEDSLCPKSNHELMHQLIPTSTLYTIAGAGHLPTLEQPEATNQLIQQWLKA